LGKSIIEAWVGKKYVEQGYPVLVTLILPYTLMTMQGASSRILLGMSKHGKLAAVTMTEGISNLALSILLVRPYGVLGDAFGTAIPMLGTYLLFMPRHLCSRLGMRLRTYVREAYWLPLLLSAPTVLTFVLMKRWFVPHTYRQLAVHLVAGGIVYAAGLAWAYKSGKALQVGDLRASIETQAELEVLATTIETLPEDV